MAAGVFSWSPCGRRSLTFSADSQTRIRVRFADRSQLEGVLPSTDKLIAIYEFVKLALAPEHRARPFVLCSLLGLSLSRSQLTFSSADQTPPRREFIKGDPQYRGKTLMDLQFTPSSVFYIKFADEALNGSSSLTLSVCILAYPFFTSQRPDHRLSVLKSSLPPPTFPFLPRSTLPPPRLHQRPSQRARVKSSGSEVAQEKSRLHG